MPENRKEAKTCHQCGLEAIDDCQSKKQHIPSEEKLAPCYYCVRNHIPRYSPMRADFFDEQWTREADKTPIIQDPDPHERQLLQTLHEITNTLTGGENIGK